MTNHSMTRRLLIGLMTSIALIWLIATVMGLSVMEEEFDETFDSSLQETAERLVPLVVDDLFRKEEIVAPQQLQASRPDGEGEYLTYQVRDKAGNVLIHSHDAPATPFQAPLEGGFWSDETHRYYTATGVSNTIFVQVADAFANRREALSETGLALFLPIFALLPLGLALSWVITRNALAPVDELGREIEAKDSGNMERLKTDALPQELLPIAGSVNVLLTRLRNALEAEREFTANSAHELRTPIAGALAQTQLLINELGQGTGRRRAVQIEASLVKLNHLAEKLLQLSRAQAGVGVSERPVDLIPVLRVLIDEFHHSGRGEDRLICRCDPEARLYGHYNADAFAIALRNLIENALIHGDPDAPVEVSLRADGSISVVNGGPVYTPDELAKLTGRFQRGHTSATGSGLGLSIATRFLEQMHATLALTSPASGRSDGFQAVIRFANQD